MVAGFFCLWARVPNANSIIQVQKGHRNLGCSLQEDSPQKCTPCCVPSAKSPFARWPPLPTMLAEWLAALAEKRQTGVAWSRDLTPTAASACTTQAESPEDSPTNHRTRLNSHTAPVFFSSEQHKLLFVSANERCSSIHKHSYTTSPENKIQASCQCPQDSPPGPPLDSISCEGPPFHFMSPVTPLQPSPERFF